MLTPIGSQISYVGSPLLIPSWAVFNVFVSLVFWIWIVAVALYYSNVWNTGYLPFQSSQGTTHPFKLPTKSNLCKQYSTIPGIFIKSKRLSMQPQATSSMLRSTLLIPRYVYTFYKLKKLDILLTCGTFRSICQ